MKSLLAPAAAALLLAGTAHAHDTWLLPAAFRAPAGGTIRLDLTSGMGFPNLDGGVAADRLAEARLRLAGRTHELTARTPGKKSLGLSVQGGGEGVAVAWVALRPRTLTLTEEQVEEYLHEIGLAEKLGPVWRSRPQPRRWRESYRKLAKAVFRVGSAEDRSWAEPVGLPLEIVPESDPTGLRAGDSLRFRVLREGQPLAGFVLAADHGHGAARTYATTDAEGRASFVFDVAGPWLLAGTDLRPTGADWESDFTTLTLEVGGR